MTPPLFTPVQVPKLVRGTRAALPANPATQPPSHLSPLTSHLSPLIDFSTGILSLGSCFADEIASRLTDGGFNVEQNPFGTLYNPASIAAALDRIIDCREITEADLVQHEGLWHSWQHHGSFSRPTAQETLEVCNSRLHQAHQALRSADVLLITFGTAWVFEVKGERLEVKGNATQDIDSTSHLSPLTSHLVVANCHKLPPQMFTRRRMTVDEIVSLWQPLLKKLRTHNSELTTIFTVSPIRHLADGAHGNQLSKATLLLAIDQLVSIFNSQFSISYFPSYEIVLDELRDYRFFGPDMTHPTALAADIVYHRLQQATMSPATIQQAHNNAKSARRSRHIPLHPSCRER